MVGIDTASAGAKVGAVALDLESDGDGINSLGQTALSGQTVNVSGNVFRLADALIDNPLAFAFGSVQVGDSVNQAVSITNNVLADGFSERLNASFGAASDVRITNNSGGFNLLGATVTDNTSLVVGIDTSVAGSVTGTQTLNFVSDGAGTSDFGTTALADQDLNVSAIISANVFRLANPVINNGQPLAFGNFREGDVVSAQALSITNDVPNDGFSEALDAQAAGTTGGVTNNGGSFTLLLPGATDDTSITVAIDTSTAGNKGGNQTVDFQSNGQGSSGLGITPLPSQDVAVTGQVFRVAKSQVTPDPVTLNGRVGDTLSQALAIANIAAADGFSEGLGVSSIGAGGEASVSGSLAGLIDAGSSDSGVIAGIDSSSAGAKSGSIDIDFTSDGSNGSSGLMAIANGSTNVVVQGNIYQAAVAGVDATPIDFGIVHVGDVVATQNIAVSNTAAVVALNDVLTGGLSQVDAPFNGSGNLGAGVAAGGTDSGSINVGLNTATSGMFSGDATLTLASHNPDLSDLGLGDFDVALTGQVNEFANPVFDFVSGDGTLSGGALAFEIDLGNIVQGGSRQSTLQVLNDVVGLADLLDGGFLTSGGGLFSLSGFTPFVDLAAGDSAGPLLVGLDTASLGLGLVTGSVILQAVGHNAGGFSQNFGDITLALRANVVSSSAAPEPPTFVILLLAGGLMLRLVRRRRHAGRA